MNIFIRVQRSSLVLPVRTRKYRMGDATVKRSLYSQQMRMTFLSFVFLFYVWFPSVVVLNTSLLCLYIPVVANFKDYVWRTKLAVWVSIFSFLKHEIRFMKSPCCPSVRGSACVCVCARVTNFNL
jgi:hypothetical protein